MHGEYIAGNEIRLVGAPQTFLRTFAEMSLIGERVELRDIAYAPAIHFLAAEREELDWIVGFCGAGNKGSLPDVFSPYVTDGQAHSTNMSRGAASTANNLLYVYNTPEAAMGAIERPTAIGAYLFGLSNEVVLDMYSPTSAGEKGWLHRIGSMGKRVVSFANIAKNREMRHQGQLTNGEEKSAMVLLPQSRDAAARQRQRGYNAGINIPPANLLVRTSDIQLTLVGTMNSSFFTRSQQVRAD